VPLAKASEKVDQNRVALIQSDHWCKPQRLWIVTGEGVGRNPEVGIT
jgi:hypothetical protein